jgi:flagellar biosynthesis protein FliR
MSLEAFFTGLAVSHLVVFARIGTAMILLPGFGETYVPMRFRLMLALLVSLVMTPATPVVDLVPRGLDGLVVLLAFEVLIGLWIGLMARLLIASLHFAGYQVGVVSNLSNATAPDAAAFQGATVLASALLLGGVALLFATNLHHQVLAALLDSYVIFPPGVLIPEDLAAQAVKVAGASIRMGLSISAPFFVMAILANLAMGLANRMMPNLAVFFVAAPVLIAGVLFLLPIAIPEMLLGFHHLMADWLAAFVF